jgi:1,2-phenylacetyl-CoA epoxidase catalytic subunit
VSGLAQKLLEIADDELILGWRDSEWTGIAPKTKMKLSQCIGGRFRKYTA